MKRILILSNHFLTLSLFRTELIDEILKNDYKVHIAMPEDVDDYFKNKGCIINKIEIDRHGLNPIKDLKYLWELKKIIKTVKPDLILSYTIKPNLYGGICSKMFKIPFLANITGLGGGMEKNIIVKKILLTLYRMSINNQECVFVQNESIRKFLIDNKIRPRNYRLIPGSGVNLKKNYFMDYPKNETIEFFFIARIMKDKGIDEYIAAAEYFKSKGYAANFHILGFCEDNYLERLNALEKKGIITYHGMTDNVTEFQKINCCTVFPSYHEGMSNVLLETAACGRPSICSDISGCNEIVDNDISGILVEPKNSGALIRAIEKFLRLSFKEKQKMGKNARKKVEKEFNRQIVIDAYIEEINKIKEKKDE